MKNSPTASLVRALLCLALLVNATARAGQQPTPAPTPPQTPQSPAPQPVGEDEIIRLDTELVQLRAVVTDRNGRLVDNLTRDDFEVFEDGKPQAVSFFSVERVPGKGDAAPAAARRLPPARTIVLFVDTLHLAAPSLFRAKSYLKKFVDETMTDRDSVAVVSTSGTLGVLQQFMSDRRMLRRAIDKLTLFPKPSTAYTPELAAAVSNGDEGAAMAAVKILSDEEGYIPSNDKAAVGYAMGRARDILGEEDSLRRATLATLAAVSDRLATMKGQRMIAYVSDGFSSYDRSGTLDRSPLQRVMGRAARSGVVIYSMYGIGLYAGGNRMLGTPSGAAQETLRDLADATGGKAFINRNDIGLEIKEMLEENSIYYSIAYYPPKGADDKKLRKLAVRVKNHPEYSVRAQRGYVPREKNLADAAATPREKLFKEMTAPLPATNINVTSSADFLEVAGDDAQVTLQVHIDGDRLQYEKQGDDELLRCEVAAVVFDKDGKIADTSAETISATLAPAQFDAARRTGYRYSKRLKLKPGLYQVRVGVREVGSELVGTSMSWVEVPDLTKAKLALSSLFLGKQGASATMTTSATDKKGARANLIVGNALIKSGETIFYRFVVYQPGATAPTDDGSALKVAIVQGDKPVYEGGWQPLASRVLRRDARGAEAGGELKATLPPGVYTLRVTVKDNASRKTSECEADFEIEP